MRYWGYLVAIPCHIMTRQRNDCCAPFVSDLGIAAGISVMLLSFGPGVLFLYSERLRRLQPRNSSGAELSSKLAHADSEVRAPSLLLNPPHVDILR